MLQTLLGIVTAASLLAGWPTAQSAESIIYRFRGGFDGFGPEAGVISDRAGNLYGTTFNGGSASGAGTVYELTPPTAPGGTWTETILHRFSYQDLVDGISPWGGLTMDRSGNLFGTTWLGGTCGDCGLVFELSPPKMPGGRWRYRIIHDFSGDGIDGTDPRADLSIDHAGDLFGTTSSGGTGRCFGGCGVVFELTPSQGIWIETILHNFPAHGFGDGANGGTGGGVTPDAAGNVYGTTFEDGMGLGSVFELSDVNGHWNYQNIYAFQSQADGFDPTAGVSFDTRGNIYGTTSAGGMQGCYGSGCGTVFRLKLQANGSWAHSILYAFHGNGDGGTPAAGVIVANGNVYGTTQLWGVGSGCPISGCGVAYRLASGTWTQTVLHTFINTSGDGFVPYGELIAGVDGKIYGATQFGGKQSCVPSFGCGTVFSLTP